MKKIILSAMAILAFGFANAQDDSGEGFSKGDVFVSGSVGFGSTKQGDVKENGFNFSPKVGFFVSENIAIGARIGFASTTQSEPEEDDFKTNEFSVGAFGRYYVTPASKFSVFAELGVDISSSKIEQGNFDAKSNGFGVGAGLGVSYFLSNNFAMEASWAGLGFNSDKADFDGAEATTSFGLNVDLSSINFGLIYKF